MKRKTKLVGFLLVIAGVLLAVIGCLTSMVAVVYGPPPPKVQHGHDSINVENENYLHMNDSLLEQGAD